MQGKQVESIEPGSIAEEIGILPGDYILTIDGQELTDILDWQLAQSSEEVILAVRQKDGQEFEYEIEKDPDEALGIIFASPTLDRIKGCQNQCVFCFVDQMPPDMRSSLYIKDDDYRLSFTSGSFITLTNLQEKDIARIEQYHLSPLYVSVHTTDKELRRKLMGHKNAGEIMSLLQRLTSSGIEFHTQIVVCPGLNDGEFLKQSIADLYSLYPSVKTLAVVPVGLTGHRSGLNQLEPYQQAEAQSVLDLVKGWQQKCLAEQKTRFVFASDEFYSLAKMPIPSDNEYEGYPQLENGVGLVRLLYNDWELWQEKLPNEVSAKTPPIVVVTGMSAAEYLRPIIDSLQQIKGLKIELFAVKNNYFGGHVTVTGLLTYNDIFSALQNKVAGKTIYLPDILFKEGTNLFLDGYTKDDLAENLHAHIKVVNDLSDFLSDLLEKD